MNTSLEAVGRAGADLPGWSNFFVGELGAAAALAGLLFVSVSMNQARILALGRIADRGLETLVMLFLVMVTASLALVPGQPLRWLGVEIAFVGAVTLAWQVPLQQGYVRSFDPEHRRRAWRMAWLGRVAIGILVAGGLALAALGQAWALYLLPPGILLVFAAVGINAWVLLIEINR